MSHISLPEKYHVVPLDTHSGTMVIEPFFPGYATTIGNAFRRVLLSSLPGSAIAAFSVKGVPHEFSTLPGVKEDFVDIALNLKQVALKVAEYVLPEGMQLSLAVVGKRTVTAGDFRSVSGVEIMNPNQVIATLTADTASLEMDAFIARGYRSIPFETQTNEKMIGRISIESWYSPVRDVAILVENIRVGQITNYERLKITIQTNGAVTPEEAFRSAVNILLEQYRAIEQLAQAGKEQTGEFPEAVERELVSEETSIVENDREDSVSFDVSDASVPQSLTGTDEETPKIKRRKTKKES